MAAPAHGIGCKQHYRAQVFACQWAVADGPLHHPLPDETALEDARKTVFAKEADCA
jgi:hypothetical protein